MTGIFSLNFRCWNMLWPCARQRQETTKRVPTRPTGLLSKQVIYVNSNKLFSYETSFLLEHCHVYCLNKLLQTHFVDTNCCCCCWFFSGWHFFPIFFLFKLKCTICALLNLDAPNSFSLCIISIFCHTMTLKTQINRLRIIKRCEYGLPMAQFVQMPANANAAIARANQWIYLCILWMCWII